MSIGMILVWIGGLLMGFGFGRAYESVQKEP